GTTASTNIIPVAV
ncbi:hypothetical protein EC960109_0265B, partial [Escherichia coli 96.0109]